MPNYFLLTRSSTCEPCAAGEFSGSITLSPITCRYASPRDKPPGLLGTTAAVLAVPGIVIGASVPMSTWTAADAASFAAMGVGVLTDAAIALTPTMNAEAVWEATIVTNDRVVMKLQEPIYIRAHDIPLYAKATNLSPVSSWSSYAPLRARSIRYDP